MYTGYDFILGEPYKLVLIAVELFERKRTMKRLVKLCSFAAICLLIAGSVASAGTVTISTSAPTTDVIASDATDATSYTKIFDYDANANHVRGNTFVTADNPAGDGWMMETLMVP